MFRELVVKKKSAIINDWIQLIFDTYAAETSKFLKLEANQFSNPVGNIINTTARDLLDELMDTVNPGTVKPLLIDIIKIRAVQDFTPSDATGFIFLLKKVVREELKAELVEKKIYSELLKFESKIDQVVLIAFDLYQECREKVYQIHLNEIKSNSLGVLE